LRAQALVAAGRHAEALATMQARLALKESPSAWVQLAEIYLAAGNAAAAQAVLEEVARADVDRIVIGGDVLPGPMGRESLARLQALDVPVDFLKGNGDRETLVERADRPSRVPESGRQQLRWCREQLTAEQLRDVDAWPPHVRLELPAMGSVLFCHATPRNDEEIVTRLIPEALLRPIFDGVADVVVCGHTHMQFDITAGAVRVVNAGSVGMPFEAAGAYWLLLDERIELRRTAYDLEAAAEAVRRTPFPGADTFASSCILQPPDMLQTFTSYGLEALTAATHVA
jgi:predicted phosphodiesterase